MTRGVKSTVLNETKYGLQFVFLSKGKRVGRGNRDTMYNQGLYCIQNGWIHWGYCEKKAD